ncbi:Protein furry-like protein [Smittium culicis]|uniref:Protein furry-like protein n=1 Tax=Smittium culicis TaxID=133412 RepID=A0A1R1Y3R6_9FUNG|nr:Protein furry-like protein [Smittium culicis]
MPNDNENPINDKASKPNPFGNYSFMAAQNARKRNPPEIQPTITTDPKQYDDLVASPFTPTHQQFHIPINSPNKKTSDKSDQSQLFIPNILLKDGLALDSTNIAFGPPQSSTIHSLNKAFKSSNEKSSILPEAKSPSSSFNQSNNIKTIDPTPINIIKASNNSKIDNNTLSTEKYQSANSNSNSNNSDLHLPANNKTSSNFDESTLLLNIDLISSPASNANSDNALPIPISDSLKSKKPKKDSPFANYSLLASQKKVSAPTFTDSSLQSPKIIKPTKLLPSASEIVIPDFGPPKNTLKHSKTSILVSNSIAKPDSPSIQYKKSTSLDDSLLSFPIGQNTTLPSKSPQNPPPSHFTSNNQSFFQTRPNLPSKSLPPTDPISIPNLNPSERSHSNNKINSSSKLYTSSSFSTNPIKNNFSNSSVFHQNSQSALYIASYDKYRNDVDSNSSPYISQAGEFAVKRIYVEFKCISMALINNFAELRLEHDPDLSQFMGKGSNQKLDITLATLGSLSKLHTRIVIELLLIWRKTSFEMLNQSLEQSHDRSSILVHERKSISTAYLFSRALYEVLLSVDHISISDELGDNIESLIFSQIKDANPLALQYSRNRRIIQEMYSKIAGSISKFRFASISDRFIAALEQFPPINKENIEKNVLLIRSFRYLKIVLHPMESLEESCHFLLSCAKFFSRISGSLILKHAWAITLSELLLPLVGEIGAEINLPSFAEAIKIIYLKASKMASRVRHISVSFPLVSATLCLSRPDFFLSKWQNHLESCIQRLKDKQHRSSAMDSICRLTWVYMFKYPDSQTSVTRKLDSLLRIFFPVSNRRAFSKSLGTDYFMYSLVCAGCYNFDYVFKTHFYPMLQLNTLNSQESRYFSSLNNFENLSEFFNPEKSILAYNALIEISKIYSSDGQKYPKFLPFKTLHMFDDYIETSNSLDSSQIIPNYQSSSPFTSNNYISSFSYLHNQSDIPKISCYPSQINSKLLPPTLISALHDASSVMSLYFDKVQQSLGEYVLVDQLSWPPSKILSSAPNSSNKNILSNNTAIDLSNKINTILSKQNQKASKFSDKSLTIDRSFTAEYTECAKDFSFVDFADFSINKIKRSSTNASSSIYHNQFLAPDKHDLRSGSLTIPKERQSYLDLMTAFISSIIVVPNIKFSFHIDKLVEVLVSGILHVDPDYSSSCRVTLSALVSPTSSLDYDFISTNSRVGILSPNLKKIFLSYRIIYNLSQLYRVVYNRYQDYLTSGLFKLLRGETDYYHTYTQKKHFLQIDKPNNSFTKPDFAFKSFGMTEFYNHHSPFSFYNNLNSFNSPRSEDPQRLASLSNVNTSSPGSHNLSFSKSKNKSEFISPKPKNNRLFNRKSSFQVEGLQNSNAHNQNSTSIKNNNIASKNEFSKQFNLDEILANPFLPFDSESENEIPQPQNQSNRNELYSPAIYSSSYSFSTTDTQIGFGSTINANATSNLTRSGSTRHKPKSSLPKSSSSVTRQTFNFGYLDFFSSQLTILNLSLSKIVDNHNELGGKSPTDWRSLIDICESIGLSLLSESCPILRRYGLKIVAESSDLQANLARILILDIKENLNSSILDFYAPQNKASKNSNQPKHPLNFNASNKQDTNHQSTRKNSKANKNIHMLEPGSKLLQNVKTNSQLEIYNNNINEIISTTGMHGLSPINLLKSQSEPNSDLKYLKKLFGRPEFIVRESVFSILQSHTFSKSSSNNKLVLSNNPLSLVGSLSSFKTFNDPIIDQLLQFESSFIFPLLSSTPNSTSPTDAINQDVSNCFNDLFISKPSNEIPHRVADYIYSTKLNSEDDQVIFNLADLGYHKNFTLDFSFFYLQIVSRFVDVIPSIVEESRSCICQRIKHINSYITQISNTTYNKILVGNDKHINYESFSPTNYDPNTNEYTGRPNDLQLRFKTFGFCLLLLSYDESIKQSNEKLSQAISYSFFDDNSNSDGNSLPGKTLNSQLRTIERTIDQFCFLVKFAFASLKESSSGAESSRNEPRDYLPQKNSVTYSLKGFMKTKSQSPTSMPPNVGGSNSSGIVNSSTSNFSSSASPYSNTFNLNNPGITSQRTTSNSLFPLGWARKLAGPLKLYSKSEKPEVISEWTSIKQLVNLVFPLLSCENMYLRLGVINILSTVQLDLFSEILYELQSKCELSLQVSPINISRDSNGNANSNTTPESSKVSENNPNFSFGYKNQTFNAGPDSFKNTSLDSTATTTTNSGNSSSTQPKAGQQNSAGTSTNSPKFLPKKSHSLLIDSKKVDRVRLSLCIIYKYMLRRISSDLAFLDTFFDTKNRQTIAMLVFFVNETSKFLSSFTATDNFEFLSLRFHFCGLVEVMYYIHLLSYKKGILNKFSSTKASFEQNSIDVSKQTKTSRISSISSKHSESDWKKKRVSLIQNFESPSSQSSTRFPKGISDGKIEITPNREDHNRALSVDDLNKSHPANIDSLNKFFSFEKKRNLYKLFESWCGFGTNKNYHSSTSSQIEKLSQSFTKNNPSVEKNQILYLIEEELKGLQNASIRAMSILMKNVSVSSSFFDLETIPTDCFSGNNSVHFFHSLLKWGVPALLESPRSQVLVIEKGIEFFVESELSKKLLLDFFGLFYNPTKLYINKVNGLFKKHLFQDNFSPETHNKEFFVLTSLSNVLVKIFKTYNVKIVKSFGLFEESLIFALFISSSDNQLVASNGLEIIKLISENKFTSFSFQKLISLLNNTKHCNSNNDLGFKKDSWVEIVKLFCENIFILNLKLENLTRVLTNLVYTATNTNDDHPLNEKVVEFSTFVLSSLLQPDNPLTLSETIDFSIESKEHILFSIIYISAELIESNPKIVSDLWDSLAKKNFSQNSYNTSNAEFIMWIVDYLSKIIRNSQNRTLLNVSQKILSSIISATFNYESFDILIDYCFQKLTPMCFIPLNAAEALPKFKDSNDSSPKSLNSDLSHRKFHKTGFAELWLGRYYELTNDSENDQFSYPFIVSDAGFGLFILSAVAANNIKSILTNFDLVMNVIPLCTTLLLCNDPSLGIIRNSAIQILSKSLIYLSTNYSIELYPSIQNNSIPLTYKVLDDAVKLVFLFSESRDFDHATKFIFPKLVNRILEIFSWYLESSFGASDNIFCENWCSLSLKYGSSCPVREIASSSFTLLSIIFSTSSNHSINCRWNIAPNSNLVLGLVDRLSNILNTKNPEITNFSLTVLNSFFEFTKLAVSQDCSADCYVDILCCSIAVMHTDNPMVYERGLKIYSITFEKIIASGFIDSSEKAKLLEHMIGLRLHNHTIDCTHSHFMTIYNSLVRGMKFLSFRPTCLGLLVELAIIIPHSPSQNSDQNLEIFVQVLSTILPIYISIMKSNEFALLRDFISSIGLQELCYKLEKANSNPCTLLSNYIYKLLNFPSNLSEIDNFVESVLLSEFFNLFKSFSCFSSHEYDIYSLWMIQMGSKAITDCTRSLYDDLGHCIMPSENLICCKCDRSKELQILPSRHENLNKISSIIDSIPLCSKVYHILFLMELMLRNKNVSPEHSFGSFNDSELSGPIYNLINLTFTTEFSKLARYVLNLFLEKVDFKPGNLDYTSLANHNTGYSISSSTEAIYAEQLANDFSENDDEYLLGQITVDWRNDDDERINEISRKMCSTIIENILSTQTINDYDHSAEVDKSSELPIYGSSLQDIPASYKKENSELDVSSMMKDEEMSDMCDSYNTNHNLNNESQDESIIYKAKYPSNENFSVQSANPELGLFSHIQISSDYSNSASYGNRQSSSNINNVPNSEEIKKIESLMYDLNSLNKYLSSRISKD